MSKREQVVQELSHLSEAEVEKVLAFVEILRAGHPGDAALASEASLARDWLRPEEDTAWAHL
jgi:hypothetical protein